MMRGYGAVTPVHSSGSVNYEGQGALGDAGKQAAPLQVQVGPNARRGIVAAARVLRQPPTVSSG